MSSLDIAISQIGVEEVPRGSNWGEDVQRYLASVGIRVAVPWCMAFVYWCVKQALPEDTEHPLIKTGGVLDQWHRVNPDLKVFAPEPGDIFIMDFGHGMGHAGFVETVDEKVIYTVEGNSNDRGSREGFEVCRRMRTTNSCIGFIRPGI